MENENKVLKFLKPFARCLAIVSILLSIASITVLVMYNFADVFTIYTDDGTKYADGFSYPGYQSIFAGVGNMIIQGYTEAGFNFLTFAGCFFPLIGCIVCVIMLSTNFARRGTNLKKAILEGIVGALLIFGAIVLFNCDKLWVEAAKNVTGSYTNYYEVYLLPAINGELYFGKDTFPSVVLIVCLIAGSLKLVNCGVLLFQKYYARSVNKEQLKVEEKQ